MGEEPTHSCCSAELQLQPAIKTAPEPAAQEPQLLESQGEEHASWTSSTSRLPAIQMCRPCNAVAQAESNRAEESRQVLPLIYTQAGLADRRPVSEHWPNRDTS